MYNILCVTNRRLCSGDFIERIEEIRNAEPCGIILREKDMTEQEYAALAEKVIKSCGNSRTKIILHTFYKTAMELGCKNLHMPLPLLRDMPDRDYFTTLGASCHSVSQAKEAQALGCTYITAGHVFDTDCKKGLPGRGLDFLSEVCRSVTIPVFAIGGINEKNVSSVVNSGAHGACVMSSVMQRENADEYLKNLINRGYYEIK